ncbi:hypothetical protein K5549_009589 [Capra hircus]|nr:hypothetical protein K5549_009589 [Capra hircus]
MVLRVTRNTKTNAENKPKISMAGAKRLPVATVATSKPGLRPTALGDILNKISEQPQAKLPREKEAKTLAAGKVTAKKVAPVPVLEPQLGPETEPEPVKEEKLSPEPILVDTPSPSPVETSGYAPAEEYLRQAFLDVILAVSDVDTEDGVNPKLCSEYGKAIYQAVKPKYLMGREVTGNMRAILIEWLVHVTAGEHVHDCSKTDRFMQDNCVPKKMLQLVGVTAMFVASKYEETYPPEIGDFAFGHPLPLHFPQRASKIGEVNIELHILAKYLMELTMLDYNMVYFPPQIAVGAFCLALKILDNGEWTPSLQHYLSYTEESLLVVMQHLAKIHMPHLSMLRSAQLNSALAQDLAKAVAKVQLVNFRILSANKFGTMCHLYMLYVTFIYF